MIPSPPNDVGSLVMWYAMYITKKQSDRAIQILTKFSWISLLPFLMKYTAVTKIIAVIPLIVAYIGGKNVRGLAIGKSSIKIIGTKFGDLKSKTNLSASHFKNKRIATTTGTKIETTTVSLL